MSPKDALDMAMARMLSPRFQRRGSLFGPGKLIESLPQEVRASLASLTVEDINKLRWDDPEVWSCSYNAPPKRFSRRYYK